MNNKTIISFLTKEPNDGLINIAKELCNYFKVYVFIDNNDYINIYKNTKINFIQINNELCITNGYQYTLEISLYNSYNKINTDKRISSYDKFFFYFTMVNLDYDYIWIFEDDVFIPHINNIIDLNNKCYDYDLVCADNKKGTNEDAKNNIWFWRYAISIFNEPSYCSMVCTCRLSNKLMIEIKKTIEQLKFIPFLEFLYNTVAYKNNLKILCPSELSTILYRKDWSIEDFKENPKNLFHPIKDYNIHEIYRKELNNIY